MTRVISLAILAACGSAAVPTAPPISHRPADVGADRRMFRQLRVGKLPIATRTTFQLVIDAARATLVETDERERRSLSLTEADHAPQWAVASQRTYRGTARTTGGTVELALESEGVQPLELRCALRSVETAAPGAVRVPSPNRASADECGDRGDWEPRAITSVRALVCDAGAGDPDPDDDDERFVFAKPPGIEYVTVNDGCLLHGGGLRLAR